MEKAKKKPLRLTDDSFNKLVEYGPLISIDLIIENNKNQILLGLRKNNPAINTWFVPGGRILKNESKEDAFKRITNDELNTIIDINDASLIDVYHHFYENDNKNNIPKIDTNYIVLAYHLKIPINTDQLPKIQHADYKWFDKDDLKTVNNIHKNVYPYFEILMQGKIRINKLDCNQYNLLNSRRDLFNNLVWQTPVTSLTAQAFLFVIALGSQVSDISKFIASLLAFIASLASIQLLMKHRFMETFHAVTLHKYEKLNGLAHINDRITNGDKNIFTSIKLISSYHIWIGLLSIFAITALCIMVNVLFPNIIFNIKESWFQIIFK